MKKKYFILYTYIKVLNCSETLISQSDYEKNILKTVVRLQGQSIYDKMSDNVIYLFSVYDKMS